MPDDAVRPDVQAQGQARRTPLYRVLLHHDGLHIARYVAQVLQEVFYFNRSGAEEITSEALYKGVALCAIEPLEQANSHAEKLSLAKLTATIELEG
jgi:ATP-dependent Clp protease adapter protein ClpS